MVCVVCCLLFDVVRRVLVVGCALFVWYVCGLLLDVRCSLCVACCSEVVACRSLCVACCVLCGVFRLLLVGRCSSLVVCCPLFRVVCCLLLWRSLFGVCWFYDRCLRVVGWCRVLFVACWWLVIGCGLFSIVVHCLLLVVRSSLFLKKLWLLCLCSFVVAVVARCSSLFVVRCVLFEFVCLLCDVRCVLCVKLVFVIARCVLCVVCCVLRVCWCLLIVSSFCLLLVFVYCSVGRVCCVWFAFVVFVVCCLTINV